MLCFGRQVTSAAKTNSSDPSEGSTNVGELRSGNTGVKLFDAVVVANGHYNKPFIAKIPSLADFDRSYPGSVSRAKFYRKTRTNHRKGMLWSNHIARNPKSLTVPCRKVVIVGNSASGIDISTQMATFCSRPVVVS